MVENVYGCHGSRRLSRFVRQFTVVLLGFIFSKEKRNRLSKHFKGIQSLRVIGSKVVVRPKIGNASLGTLFGGQLSWAR